VTVTVLFFALAMLAAPDVVKRAFEARFTREINPVATLLLLFFAISLAALALGVPPFLGAFAAGIASNRIADPSGARDTIKRFSFAFPVPLYFALVGLRLDLARHFPLAWFLGFFAFACTVKLLSCYVGARIAKERHAGALNLAVAMNARGGPGIVLASLALDAGIIDERLYVALVMLAIVTSCIAGAWLGRIVRAGKALL
jgi:Kef-type K+ transport system membrane component KefB